jgi:hypothetical protein
MITIRPKDKPKQEFKELLLNLALHVRLVEINWSVLNPPFDLTKCIVLWIDKNIHLYDGYSEIACRNMQRGAINNTTVAIFYRWVFLVLGEKYVPDNFTFSTADRLELQKAIKRSRKK